ncbi:hypothetical protein ADN00_12440 [Ornatilinea apprima]|uniref:Uncharacterized protein n=1 Tax=Ornatilinea apprima TaxID=1134406 RepID=A0A0N8GMS8_9CHLR|nr:hypothetical protein [Ornatilinea apprima]KPL76138.1 hypothetical protein ADN00_12440 [Ornatilinea apprima]
MAAGMIAGAVLFGLSWLPVKTDVQRVVLNPRTLNLPTDLIALLEGRELIVDAPTWLWQGGQSEIRLRTNLGSQTEALNLILEANLAINGGNSLPIGELAMPIQGTDWKELRWQISDDEMESGAVSGTMWVHATFVRPAEQQKARTALLAKPLDIPVRSMIPGLALGPQRWIGVGLFLVAGCSRLALGRRRARLD